MPGRRRADAAPTVAPDRTGGPAHERTRSLVRGRSRRDRAAARAGAALRLSRPRADDPLAELARIVGQDDPSATLLGERSAPERRRGARADRSTTLSAVRTGAVWRARAREPRPSRSLTFEPEAQHAHRPMRQRRRAAAAGSSRTPTPVRIDRIGLRSYAASGHARRRTTRRLTAPARALAQGVLALGASLAWSCSAPLAAMHVQRRELSHRRAASRRSSRPTTSRSRSQPQNPAASRSRTRTSRSTSAPARTAQTKVVNREEQPVDVQQAARARKARRPGRRRRAALRRRSPGHAPSIAPSTAVTEPRRATRVRTVSVRPDGTLVSPDQPPAATALAAAPAAAAGRSAPTGAHDAPLRAARRPSRRTPAPAARSRRRRPRPPPRPSRSDPRPQPAPARPAPHRRPRQHRCRSLRRRAAAAGRVASATASGPPRRRSRPGRRPPSAASRCSCAVDALRGGGAGGLPASSSSKYAGQLAGTAAADPRAPRSTASTVYRVRVGPMSRDDATALCTSCKAAGGQCFVAKN